MTSTQLQLTFIRLSGILAQGFLLISATVLFVFGMLEMFGVLAAFALLLVVLVWMRASAVRADAEFADNDLGRRIDRKGAALLTRGSVGISSVAYARPQAFRVRAAARKVLSLPADRSDAAQALTAAFVWLAFLAFFASVVASS